MLSALFSQKPYLVGLMAARVSQTRQRRLATGMRFHQVREEEGRAAPSCSLLLPPVPPPCPTQFPQLRGPAPLPSPAARQPTPQLAAGPDVFPDSARRA